MAALPILPTSLQDLPNELLLQILGHLSLQDLSNLHSVNNQHFCRLIIDNDRDISLRLIRETYAAYASAVPLPNATGINLMNWIRTSIGITAIT